MKVADLDAMTERMLMASGGPWEVAPWSPGIAVIAGRALICTLAGNNDAAVRDAEFISRARTDTSALIGEVRRLRAIEAAALVLAPDVRRFERVGLTPAQKSFLDALKERSR